MSNNVAWLLLSFAVMLVAVLAVLHEKLEGLEKRLSRLEGRGQADDDGSVPADPVFTQRGTWRQ
ncbi:MAG TPA: hypothetical protein VMS64_14910 [Candidatus Methylomirabilis sp.]|nr:hypothetical protein [Candidatus Methylomirabilis sp.]